MSISGTKLVGKWSDDPDHGPWQRTAPLWAVARFAEVTAMVADGRWGGDHPVGPLLDGHLVHCDGVWDGDEMVVPPSRNTYYAAYVRWDDGEIHQLVLWHD
jgi:hypothetical protein